MPLFIGQLLAKLLEIHSANQLHRNEINPVGFAQMIRLDDVGVDQVRDQFGFADEVVDELLLVGVILADDFDGDALDEFARAMLLGFIDNAHAAFKNFSHDVVAKFVLNSEESHEPIVIIRGFMSSLPFWLRDEKSPDFPGIFFNFLLARAS